MQKMSTCLWFNGQAEAAAKFYTSVFKDSKMGSVARYSKEVAAASGQPEGSVMTATFHLNGQKFLALNGGPQFKLSEAVSFIINCETQEEVDYYWDKLSEGGEIQMCGWLKDKFGVSWQVVPTLVDEVMSSGNTAKANNMLGAIMQMKKLDVDTLKEAYENG